MRYLLLFLLLLVPAAAFAQAPQVPLLSFDRVACGVAVVHEWNRPESGDFETVGYLVGLTPSYNLLYPSAEAPGTPDISIVSSIFYGIDRSDVRARVGVSWLFLRGGD